MSEATNSRRPNTSPIVYANRKERQATMVDKRWIEYRYITSDQASPLRREWHLDQRSVMDAKFQPRASRLVKGAIAEGQLIAYVLVNCDAGGTPLILEGHDNLADRMFKQCLPGDRLT
jgi:hypothetical protein